MGTRSIPVAAGIAAGAVTLGVAELLAAALVRTSRTSGTPSPLLAVGAAFVNLTPAWLKDWAVATFGTADKVALFIGMGLALLVLCAGIGLLAEARRRAGLAALTVIAGVGAAAVLTRPDSVWTDALPTVAGACLGWFACRRLLDVGTRSAEPHGPNRREVLLLTGAVAALGGLGILLGRLGQGITEAAQRARRVVVVPEVTAPVVVPPAATSDITGHTPYVTGNADFYRIDTALVVPQVDPDTWTLRVTGLVEREVVITLDELLATEMVEALVTLTCVSNEVGGNLAGNAIWTGWPVRHLLARAGVLPEADMVLSRSADGWTAGTPLEVLTDDRAALLAVGMNGEPLPAQHGFPARLVVPGLFGYVSATKWVTELKVTRFDADEGYWTPRGWSERGPVKTASRIDVPRQGTTVRAGRVVIAGVAWAQTRGIVAVEVRIDGGPWRLAELRAEPSVDSWRLWSMEWDAQPGAHELQVRATDGDGAPQTEQQAPPVPDGASGWHTVRVHVE